MNKVISRKCNTYGIFSDKYDMY